MEVRRQETGLGATATEAAATIAARATRPSSDRADDEARRGGQPPPRVRVPRRDRGNGGRRQPVSNMHVPEPRSPAAESLPLEPTPPTAFADPVPVLRGQLDARDAPAPTGKDESMAFWHSLSAVKDSVKQLCSLRSAPTRPYGHLTRSHRASMWSTVLLPVRQQMRAAARGRSSRDPRPRTQPSH